MNLPNVCICRQIIAFSNADQFETDVAQVDCQRASAKVLAREKWQALACAGPGAARTLLMQNPGIMACKPESRRFKSRVGGSLLIRKHGSACPHHVCEVTHEIDCRVFAYGGRIGVHAAFTRRVTALLSNGPVTSLPDVDTRPFTRAKRIAALHLWLHVHR